MAAEAKTKPTAASVDAYLKKSAADAVQLAEYKALATMMQKATGKKPVMWGSAIVGFGTYPIVYADGRTEEWPVAAFSPRKPATVIYGLRASPKYAALLKKLGKHKVGGGCVYIKSLADVDVKVLDELVSTAVKGRLAKVKKG
jgi:hypothetical protein